MASRIARADIDARFSQWLTAGREVGALPDPGESVRYALAPGSDTNGIAWTIQYVGTLPDGSRCSGVPSLGVPYLGRTARSAYDVFSAMLAAWRMIIDNERAQRAGR